MYLMICDSDQDRGHNGPQYRFNPNQPPFHDPAIMSASFGASLVDSRYPNAGHAHGQNGVLDAFAAQYSAVPPGIPYPPPGLTSSPATTVPETPAHGEYLFNPWVLGPMGVLCEVI